jgi:V-type H+-transporting ATPase subunit a
MGWFRSEEMAYVTILMNKDAAHQCVDKLGKLEDGKGAIQFIDVSLVRDTFNPRRLNTFLCHYPCSLTPS